MNYYIQRNYHPDFLMHYGVKGMKWGVRNDNPNYSAKQRKRDKSIYGSSGVRRINRHMNRGETISAARSKEADRIHRFRRAAVVGGQVGRVGGGIAGAIVGKKVMSKIGKQTIPTEYSFAVSAGASSVGSTLGRYGGQSIVMIAGGYSPSKFRYN